MRRLALGVLLLVTTAGGADAGAAVMHWGGYGSAGFGLESSPTDVGLPAKAGTIIKVDGGNAAGYALSSKGTLWAFGKNRHGELGIGTDEEGAPSPVAVQFPQGTKIVAVGEADQTGFAVDSTGQAWSWGTAHKEGGSGDAQSLCLGRQTADVLSPREIAGLTKVRAVQGGATHVIWLMKDGTVRTCGDNDQGQLGIGSAEPGLSYTPVTVPGLKGVAEVSAGQATACARTTSGEVYVWGGDRHGQVGNGSEDPAGVFSPYHVPLPGPATDISCGGNYGTNGSTLAIVGGVVYGWGDDEAGQLGDGATVNQPSPTVARETSSLNLSQVVASGAYSLGVNPAGEVYGWGSNKEFAIAAPKRARSYLAPQLIDTGATEVSATAFDSLQR